MTVDQIAEAAGVDPRTVLNQDYRALIDEENVRRQVDTPTRDLVFHDTGTAIREELKTLEGLVSVDQIAEAAGIDPQTVLNQDYRALIAEENAHRRVDEPTRELVFHDTGTMIREELKTLEGLVSVDQIAEAAGIDPRTVLNQDVRALIAEENARRRVDEPTRRFVFHDTGDAIREELKTLEGLVSVDQIAEAAGIDSRTVLQQDNRTLIIEENVRRQVAEPDRAPVILAADVRGERPRATIAEGLKTLDGLVTVDQITASVGGDPRAVLREDIHALIAEENARRRVDEPTRGPVFHDAGSAIREGLKTLEGLVTVDEIIAASGISLRAVLREDYRALIAEENARRRVDEPTRRLVFHDTGTAIREGFKILEGLVTIDEITAAAGVSRETVLNRDYRALIAEENARRRVDEPTRELVFHDTSTAIREGLKTLERLVTIDEITTAAGVSRDTVLRQEYRTLIAEENARRRVDEPTRDLVFHDTGTAIHEGLKILEGQVSVDQIAAAAGIDPRVVREEYRALIAEENARRRVDEPTRRLLFHDTGTAIREGLKTLEGLVSFDQIAAAAGVDPRTVRRQGYRTLIAEENARRRVDEPTRGPVFDDAGTAIREELRTLAGLVTVDQIAAAAGISRRTVLREDVRALIAEENARRRVNEPTRRLVFHNTGTAIREGLKTLAGLVSVDQIAAAAEVSRDTVLWEEYRTLIAEENARRRVDEPTRDLVFHDTATAIREGLKTLEGLVAVDQIAEAAGGDPRTVLNHDVRVLIAEENVRRRVDEPTRRLVFHDTGTAIREGLKTLEGLVAVDQITAAAGVSRDTVLQEDVRSLIAEENARRRVEEPQRVLVFHDIDTAIREGLKTLEGQVSVDQIAETTGVDPRTVRRQEYRILIDEENARRATEESEQASIFVHER